MSTQNSNSQKNNDIGVKIQESVLEALRTGDFSKLNVDITDSVKEVLNGVGDTINSAVSEARSTASGTTRGFTSTPYAKSYRDIADIEIARHQAQREQLKKRAAKKIKFVDKGGVMGFFQIIFGWPITVVGLVATFSGLGEQYIAGFMLGLLILVGGISAIIRGINKIRYRTLAVRYRDLCKDKQYESIDTIANATGVGRERVIKNIKNILKRGFFPEGYLDEQETTFMVSKEVYDQYLLAEDTRKAREQEEIERAKNDQMTSTEQSELDVMIKKGDQYISRLRQLNDNIPGEVITQKLSKLEGLLGEIFDRVREHPEQMVNCRKLMDYYLPTMIKLVEAYEEYDKVSQPGEDIIAAKNEIEKTLDIINQAFVELLNKLFQSSVWDVKAEANVLKTMLRQEGLADDRFAGMRDTSSVSGEEDTVYSEEEDGILIEQNEQVEVPVLKEL
ncbi:MAG: 5-bromo-4-chloroindolyl phosphate hydrolysis family protein [Lachnospiraceae bacterium]|nr:5-bromo-4-chloroindolyl phosphate hydrolysis family protein [Lachnospiraceae bacterium]